MNYKAMSTPMVTNLKLLNDDSLETIDVTLYKQIISSLVYFTNTRWDICFDVNTLSQYISEASTCSLNCNKTCDEVPKGYIQYFGLRYAADSGIKLHDYTNLDWEGSAKARKRTWGCCFCFGSGVILRLSRKQTCVSLSMIEDEYIVACSSCNEVAWLQKMLIGLFDTKMDVIDIYCDNQSCSKLTETWCSMTNQSMYK